MKKLGFMTAVAALCISPTLAIAQDAADRWKQGDQWNLVFGSATATGSYFAGMSAVATMLSQKMDNVIATATVSPNTTTEVYPQMVRGERVGGVASQDLLDAYEGSNAWEGRKIPVRGWSLVQEGFFNIFVRKSLGITKVSELADSGARIAAACVPPEPGNPQRWDQPFTFFNTLMEAHGLDAFEDVTVVPYCTSQAIEQLGAGNIDGMSHTRGLGGGAIRELMTKQDLVLLQPDEDAVAKITSEYPVYIKDVPTDVYPELEIPEPGIGFFHGVYFFLHEDLPDELVYDMTKTLFENLDVLRNAHPAYKGLTVEEALKGMPIPPHPGALKYYKEVGVPGAEDFAAASSPEK
ncbi:TAXI family TRAP transporter solute-binding subunit [Aurantimonas sp. C2-5-R2]|uniref:TAXI family TRAP transporter solute-binding subunit n=1 Tax=Aurantimonas sp. C2-5-R2 TaxID=3113713 RepID=UPI002F951D41